MVKLISHSDILDQKLKSCDSHIKKYVIKLESYIAQLESENAALKAKNIVLNHRVKALEAEMKKNVNLAPTTINFMSNARPATEGPDLQKIDELSKAALKSDKPYERKMKGT